MKETGGGNIEGGTMYVTIFCMLYARKLRRLKRRQGVSIFG